MKYPNYITLDRGEQLLLARAIRNALANSYFYEVLEEDEIDFLVSILKFFEKKAKANEGGVFLVPESAYEEI